MATIGPRIGEKVLVGQNLYKAGNSVPHCLRLREVPAGPHTTFGARGKTLRPATAVGLASPAGMKELLVGPQAAPTGDVHKAFVELVYAFPRRRGALLLLHALKFAVIRGTIGAQYSARRDHFGSVVFLELDLVAHEQRVSLPSAYVLILLPHETARDVVPHQGIAK